jgi:putative MATE family efflux protein
VNTDSEGEPENDLPNGGWRHRDHTRGGLLKSLLVLALPLVTSGLLGGVLFQLVDLHFVSQLGETAISAVVITNQTVRQAAFMLLMGGAIATQSLISRAVGAGDVERAEHIAGQSITFGLAFAALVATVGGVWPEALFALSGPDPSFYAEGVPYLRLVSFLFVGAVGSMLFGAILGGAGDTTTPLLVQFVQFPVAIAAEWLLIFGHLGAPALGVLGVALGVATGHLAAGAIAVWVLFSGRARVHIRLRHLLPDPAALRQIGALAAPSALQMIGGVAVNFVFIRLAGGFGEAVQTAFAIGLRLSMIVPMICFPLASACATLVGQNLGARNVPRAWRAVGVGLGVHASITWSVALVIFGFRESIMAAFSDNPEVIRVGREYLAFTAGSFFFWGFQFVFMRSLQGAGDFIVPMLISLTTTFGLSIPLGLYLSQGELGATGIWTAQLVSAGVGTLSTGAWLATGRWTRRGAPSLPS